MYRLVDNVFGHFNKRSSILIHTPNRRSFGECAKDMYFGLLKAQRENKKILFVYPRNLIFKRMGFSVVNRELFDLESEYIISSNGVYGTIAGILLSIYTMFLFTLGSLRSLLNKIWLLETDIDFGFHIPRIGRSEIYKPHDVNYFSWEFVEMQDWGNQHQNYLPPKLKKNKKDIAAQIRVQLGIPLDSWYVCLHFRTNEMHSNRNQTIENCKKGIEAINNAGGWVVRLGDNSMPPLPNMDKVIDYAHSSFKSELMDLYLISECKFLIGISSGPYVVSNLLKKPVLSINMTDWGASMILKKNDLAIPKHVYSLSKKRFFSVKEVLDHPKMVQIYGNTLGDFELIENSSDEICEAIEEFLNRTSSNEYSDLQSKYNDARRNQLRRCLQKGEPKAEWMPIFRGVPKRDLYMESYRMSAAVDLSGTLANSYLEKNWYRDDFNYSSK